MIPHPSPVPETMPARNLGWLIDRFVTDTPGVLHAVVVSVDGLLVVMDEGCGREAADQLSAVVAGLNQMCAGAGEVFGAGALQQQLVQYASGFIILRSMARGSVIAAVTQRRCDMAQVGHELVTLSQQVGEALNPALITELRRSLPA